MTPTTALAFAQYNRWMNEKLLAGCAELSDDERKLDRNAPFKSIHGIWNHILLADRIWLGRFLGEPYSFKTLGDEVCADFAELRAELAKADDAIEAFAEGLTDEKLASIFEFTPVVNPVTLRLPLWLVVTHMFNHQTHHRGQITALMEQAGLDCGVTDILRLPGWGMA
jgi:uncharacterized damage-inducible protein DinB